MGGLLEGRAGSNCGSSWPKKFSRHRLSQDSNESFSPTCKFRSIESIWTPRRLLTQPRRSIFALKLFKRRGGKSGKPPFPEAISNHAAHSAVPKPTRRRRPPAAKIMQGGPTGKKYEVILFLRCQICSYSTPFQAMYEVQSPTKQWFQVV